MKRYSTAASQLDLLGPPPAAIPPDDAHQQFRPIHYLGSKLRLLTPIRDAVRDVARRPGPVVDLFAGSGTVSLALAQEHEVVAVDIQEYSRVLCSAVLTPLPPQPGRAESLVASAAKSQLHLELRRALIPITEYEGHCLASAGSGNFEPLCEFVEHASLFEPLEGRPPTGSRRKPRGSQFAGAPARAPRSLSAQLTSALEKARSRLHSVGLDGEVASLATRYFGGPYFSFAQAMELDCLLDRIHSRPNAERDYFLAMVLSTASEVVNTVGKQFAQPIRPRDARGRPKAHLARQIIRDRSRSVSDCFLGWAAKYEALHRTSRRHTVARQDYRAFLNEGSRQVSVVYADPPYTRDHYSRYYHVLETLSLRDNPKVSSMRVAGRELLSRGFYREDRHQSPFCIKSQAPGAFELLFEGVARLGAPLVLSYSPYQADANARPRLMKVEDIAAIARNYFAKVEVRSVGRYAHNKFNHQELNTKVFYDSEVLVVCSV